MELSEVLVYLPSFTTGVYILNLIVILVIIYEGRDARTTFAWIFLILLLPIIGLVLFFLFGRIGLSKSSKIINQEKLLQAHLQNLMSEHHVDQASERALLKKRGFYRKYKHIYNLASQNPEALLSSSNRVTLYHDGVDKFNALYEDIRQAKKFVHLAYFIWRNDALTKKFVELLETKVKEGVEVRIFLDYVGSVLLSPLYLRKLRKLGIKLHFFSALYSSTQIHTINYRNHMKIAVIDGRVAYTGGMNMGNEYAYGGRFAYWRDTHLRIEGEAAQIYNGLFLAFWHRVSKERFPDQQYFPRLKNIKGSTVQIIGSGIDINASSMEYLLLNLIVNARKSVYIQTPYFIPSESISTALKVAALSGVKVHVMVTGVPDKHIPYWSAFNYYRELLDAGVLVYQYHRGFMHAKTIIVDNEVSIVGSTNIDIRSFKLNYELGTILYDFRLSRELVRQFKTDLRYSKRLTLEDLKKQNIFVKFRNSFFRLFSPLL